ncbi:MAG: hypothetical protein EOO47_09980 [Flavobacterium sp.]|nr:MAG: hypothetical protein EOO47_09980 [Flavobacterium sp.]
MIKTYLFMLIMMVTTALGCNFNQGRQSIIVKSNDKGYWFVAEYPQSKTKDVVAYVEKSLNQNDFFADDNGFKTDKDVSVNGANFEIDSSPGKLAIGFEKRDNSETSYQQMIDLCEGIKETLQ